ncbi:intermembrane lipid transfer protein VPS13D-like isoform X2 [Scylla paramamosain]|uniref:intermembrane lipid transfer protein VPS13D-like isoform X2 n=1 Tax=Scylla paramamosain TaxID=85552 RepID=UPI00308287BB
MLEGLATWVLNNYLGKYLENLNTDQLSIGLLKGEVELENVPLRKDALRHLDMPMEVLAGFVGRVKLQIPVSRLRSEPWVIKFEQLYLVAGPIKLEEFDEEAEAAAAQARKISQLDALEAAWRADQEACHEASHYAHSYSSWLSYGTSFMTNIIENIQLKIRDVHLRYEDDRCIPNQVFACGLTIDSLALQSSDEQWRPRYVFGSASKMAYKLLELTNMGLYWDTSASLYSDKPLAELTTLMLSGIEKRDHEYLLSPVSATACVKRNLCEAPLRSRSNPRISCDLRLDKFPLNLDETQYRQLVRWSREYDRLDLARHYRKWRPAVPVRENVQEWWQFPIQCHLERIHRTHAGRTWPATLQRARDIVRYVEVYCEHLKQPATVPAEHKAQKLRLEQALGFGELCALREVAMARVGREMKARQDKDIQPSASLSTSPTYSGEGILQRWFPTWGGWYTSEPAMDTEETNKEEELDPTAKECPPPKTDPSGTEEVSGSLEEEILYVLSDTVENNTFMKRDAVFCKISFTLKQSSFCLSSSRGGAEDLEGRAELFELEFADVKMGLESRPRSKSYKFDIELGSLMLKDKVTPDTVFPQLLSPQNRAPVPSFTSALSRTSTMYAKLTSIISPAQTKSQGPLFSLCYECRPFNSKADHRLVITSSALDMVYNPAALDAIKVFFTLPYYKRGVGGDYGLTPQMAALTSAARKRYEELKEQTKQELKRNWEQMMEGDMVNRKRWDIKLDISAPQIIIPEHFQDKNAVLVVLDFGRLVFCSAQPPMSVDTPRVELDLASEDEDEFATPCSTPDELESMSPQGERKDSQGRKVSAPELNAQFSETLLHDRIYDKYDLRLSDMQVLVGKVHDNWRFAYLKGTGHMHVLDRFSINLQLERRVVPIHDAQQQWPSATLSGTLPKLVLHINEQKVQALHNMITKFYADQPQDTPRKDSDMENHRGDDLSSSVISDSMTRSNTLYSLGDQTGNGSPKGTASPTDEGKLLMVQFTVDRLSLELQSRGRSVAELQVTGVRANLNKRPHESTATLSVHSLLLVDALQTFGPDFELLVASHKHVSMDSVSGSLLDSDPCSPTSPASPDHNAPLKLASPITISHAISSYAASRAQSPPHSSRNIPSPPPVSSPMFGGGGGGGGGSALSFTEARDTEALIILEVTYVTALCPSQQDMGSLLVASVQFNTLDIIANQETVVELVGFLHQLFPRPSLSSTPLLHPHHHLPPTEASAMPYTIPQQPEREIGSGVEQPHVPGVSYVAPEKSPVRGELSFDFHKLTVLLLRGVYKDKDLVGRKVGTAVLSDAKIQATVDSGILNVEGSLGGFQVRDVTPEGSKHQCIISVGQDPIVERSQDLFSHLNSDLYRSYSAMDNAHRAFSFKVIRPLTFTQINQKLGETVDNEDLRVQLRLASVCYTHSPHFLKELRSCATEFKHYMTVVASSLKHAATEMAMGLVSKRIESFAGLASSQWDASPHHQRRLSVSRSTDTLNLPAPPPASASGSHFSPVIEDATDLPFSLNLDIVLETPVVVLPESLNSPDVLVAHLGQISINNAPQIQPITPALSAFPPSKVAEYRLIVRDMSLFSLNVEERLKSRDSTFQWFHNQLLIIAPLSTTVMGAEELYSCRDHGCPILHSTTVEMCLTHEKAAFLLTDLESGLYFPTDFSIDGHPPASRDSLQIDGGIVTPLKVSVSRQQYRQVVKTLSNLSVPNTEQNTDQPTKSSPGKEGARESSSSIPQEAPEDAQRARGRQSPTVAVKGSFSVPSMCVELRGDVGEREKPLVNLLLEEIKVVYESCEPYKNTTQVTLRSLMMEDLQQSDTCTEHKFLMNSHTDSMDASPDDLSQGNHHFHFERQIPKFISTSCPEPQQPHGPLLFPSSLPSKLRMEKPFFKAQQKPVPLTSPAWKTVKGLTNTMMGSNNAGSPCTPPPSPNTEEEGGSHFTHRPHTTLVTITITNIDKMSPEFHSKYDQTHRFIDVDFNSLNTIINISSWVMVLDFFSTDEDEASPPKAAREQAPSAGVSKIISTPATEEFNSIVEVQVRLLGLTLVKAGHPLARASISQVVVRSVGSGGNLTLNGRLGSLSLVDCSSHSLLYPEKFITAGSEAMTFQLFKYGHEDPEMQRVCDVRLKLKMSSVMYLHTHRFASEITQFVQQFNQLRDIVSRWRATSAGLKVSDFSRGSRVSLDISAGSPVIFLPMSSQSNDLLMGDLGSITLKNTFLWAGSEGTIKQVRELDTGPQSLSSLRLRQQGRQSEAATQAPSHANTEVDVNAETNIKPHRCLLDVMFVSLVNMDIHTGTRSPTGHSQRYQKQLGRGSSSGLEDDYTKKTNNGGRNGKEDRKARKNTSVTEEVEWVFGSYVVKRIGTSLLHDKCALELQVERNLDTAISHAVPDISIHGTLSKVHSTIDTAEYKLIRGVLMFNLGEPLPPPPPPTYLYQTQPQQVWPLVDVWTSFSITLVLDNVTLELDHVGKREAQACSPLACINFIRSRLTFESFSDESKDVDLVSQEILISDTRFEGFPVNKRSNIFTNILQPTPLKSAKNNSQLQAEVHYRSTKNVTRFTILLNNMRLMGILSWWMEVLEFIYTTPDNPFLAGKVSKKEPNKEESLPQSSVITSGVLSSMHSPSPCSPMPHSPESYSPRPHSPTSTSQRSRNTRLAVLPRLNPMVESTGVMTKHTIMQDQGKVPFELKLNITDSELVVVENTALWDTSAVILKSTAVISYRPQHQERPLSCNLNQCELYSCILGLEEDTALSIIDPVTVNIEVNDRLSHSRPVDISNMSMSVQHTVEVWLHQLNIRLSYHDMKMFQQMFESVSKQREASRKPAIVKEKSQPANFQAQVEKLSALGFQEADCRHALEECGGRLDDAALWLTHNAHPLPAPTLPTTPSTQEKAINFHAIEIKTGGVNICVIDDCGDCDVPLLEVSLAHLGLKQDWLGKGTASCSLSVDYYNRALSGWEPFLEPWLCRAEWNKGLSRDLSGERLSLTITTEETINMNLTNALLDLCHTVKSTWTQDYYNRDRLDVEACIASGQEHREESDSSSSNNTFKTALVSPQGYRRRSPFIPFGLKNDTGCDLSFATLTTTPDNMMDLESPGQAETPEREWVKVSAGSTVPFSFEGRGKQRHRDTHELKVHQLLVHVEGWQEVGPVTVDKVGVFFRVASPDPEIPPTQTSELPNARIIIAVTLDGSARKLVTVRSALQLTNLLHCPVDVRLENSAVRLGDTRILHIGPKSTVPVPLLYLWAGLFVRPANSAGVSWLYCREALHWQGSPQEGADPRVCAAINAHIPSFRFCVHLKRDNFPADADPPSPGPKVSPFSHWVQPGHTIMLVSPLTMVNLLPYDLHYEVKIPGTPKGRIRPGEDACLHSVDPAESVTLMLWTDTLSPCGEICLNPSSSPYLVTLKLQDVQKRLLYLHIKVHLQYGGALKVVVYASYWLINKTGLPLIFRQEGVSTDAAGQDSEHEVARCAAPLLFSFSDREANPMVVARVGNQLHPGSQAQYCHKLPLTQGTWVRRLRVSPPDNRPDLVYIVGVDVRPGRGRYRDTYMVTFSPRFQIENRSSHELIIAQKSFTTTFSDPCAQSTWLRAIPGCWLPFHWPRLDKEQLLSICLRDVPGCYWSGGFFIEKIDSFYLNIRDNDGRCFFLRVEVIISDATFFIVFTDAETLPPPFRIDNFSEVSITFFQTGTQEERLRAVVKPRSCVSYAWDEVCLPPYLTCVAPGGTSVTYNMNILGEGARLTYENFIYIALTGTFRNASGSSSGEEDNVTFDPSALECQQLVLDVPEGTMVKLSRKENGRRSQLWRMTSTGRLQHEGSSPPHDPSSRKAANNAASLVLDIAGCAPQPSEYVPLMLRKPDERRRLTQTWRFTEDGRLCCIHVNMFVQAKDGFLGLIPGSHSGGSWQLWNDVVLGPPQLVQYDTLANGVPLEQAISRQRLRPGSGMLSVRVDTDGPTRVLQITDVHSKGASAVARTESGDWVSLVEEGGTTTIKKTSAATQQSKDESGLHEMELQLKLQGGIGLSLILQSPPEELIYAKLTDIVFQYQSSPLQRTIDCSVRDIQVDNQLLGAQCPIVLYVTPQSKNDETRYLPAIYLTAHQLLSSCTNSYIFKNLNLTMKNLTLTLEESLVFKLLLLAGYDQSDSELEKVEERQYDMRRMLAAATSANATRYYFTILELQLKQVRLSVLTSKKLSSELKNVKRKMGLTLVRFEHASVNLEPFVRRHPFETSRFLLDCITKHYKEELKSQAMKILGSTDFLGNPSGFLADVSEGVSELVHEGSVGGLVWNVTHGMANSTAKVTGSLSDAVGHVTMDDKHEEHRQKLRLMQTAHSTDHIMAGLKGLGLGLYGGLTSIVSQTYTGATQEGLPGFISGFAKGMVGTVTKPAIGLLDLASSTSLAVRDSSKNPLQKMPNRIRKPRLVVGLNGLIPRYNVNQAEGQELLLSFEHNENEIFLGYDVLREGEGDMKVLISSQQVRVFSQSDPALPPTPVLNVPYRDLYHCKPVILQGDESEIEHKHYIELTLKAEWPEGHIIPRPSDLAYKRPKVRCDSQEIAHKVAQQINYARNLHDELRQTLLMQEEETVE